VQQKEGMHTGLRILVGMGQVECVRVGVYLPE